MFQKPLLESLKQCQHRQEGEQGVKPSCQNKINTIIKLLVGWIYEPIKNMSKSSIFMTIKHFSSKTDLSISATIKHISELLTDADGF